MAEINGKIPSTARCRFQQTEKSGEILNGGNYVEVLSNPWCVCALYSPFIFVLFLGKINSKMEEASNSNAAGKKRRMKFVKKANAGNINTLQNFVDIIEMNVYAKASFSIVKDVTRKSCLHDLNTQVCIPVEKNW